MAGTPAYTFGDTELAAKRLALVAETFDEPTRRFVRATAPPRPALVLDLGCGPGHTTRLLADETDAVRVVGIDSSAAFVDAARAAFPAPCDFVVGDVLQSLPHAGRADIAFARLLLAHLPDPVGVVRRWAPQLRPGARLLLDEVESMDAPTPALEHYETLVIELVSSRGALMYAGPLVGAMRDEGWRRLHDDVVTWRVPVPRAAAMYRMNLATWRYDPFVTERHDAAEIDELDSGLRELELSGSGDVTWELRQIALEIDQASGSR